MILVVSMLLAAAAAADLHHVQGAHRDANAPSLVYQQPKAQIRQNLGQVSQQASNFNFQQDQQNLGHVSSQKSGFSIQVQDSPSHGQVSSQSNDFSFQAQIQQQPEQLQNQQQGIELTSTQSTIFQSQPQQQQQQQQQQPQQQQQQQRVDAPSQLYQKAQNNQVSNGVFFRVEGSQEVGQSQQSVDSFDDQIFDIQVSTDDQQSNQNVFSFNNDDENSLNNQFDFQSQNSQFLDPTEVDAPVQSQQIFRGDIQQSTFPVIQTQQVQQQVINPQDNVQTLEQTYSTPQSFQRQDQFVFTQNVQEQNTAQVLPQPLQPNNQQFVNIPQTLPQPLQPVSQQDSGNSVSASYQQPQAQNQFVSTNTQTRPQVNPPPSFNRPQVSPKPVGQQPQAPPQRPQVQPQPIEVLPQPQPGISIKPFERPSSLRPLPRPQTKIDTTKCGAGLLVDIDGNCVEPQISRNIFLYAAPEKQRSLRKRPVAPKPKLEYNIVFVRNPDDDEDSEPIVVPPPQQKTLVYVLNEKSEAEELGLIETPSHPKLKPEVYFVNYGQGENPELPGGIDLQSALREMVLEGTVIEDFSGSPFEGQQISQVFDDVQETSGLVDVQTQTTVVDSSEGLSGYDYSQQNPSIGG